MTCSGEVLANVNLKWLCFPGSRITEQNLIWYVDKLQWEFIPILIALFLFPYFYSHSHSHSFDIVIVTLILMGVPWNKTHEIPIVPIPMHISGIDCGS